MNLPFALYADLLAVPYVRNGRTMEGLDCVGLFLVIQERLGREVSFYTSDEKGLEVAGGQWVKVSQPQPGDGILLYSSNPPWHVGVVISQNLFIHAKESAGVVVERYDGAAYRRRTEGFYSWRQPASAQ